MLSTLVKMNSQYEIDIQKTFERASKCTYYYTLRFDRPYVQKMSSEMNTAIKAENRNNTL